MGRWGKVDFKQLDQFHKNIEKLSKVNQDEFCELAAKELAARLLAKVIKRTPVGVYPAETGKMGGTLRRGWTADSQRHAELGAVFGGGTGAKKYADSLEIKKSGNTYIIEIVNPVDYASYVEYGHRTRGGKGWVKGRFMLTNSEIELEQQAPGVLEKKLKKYLLECFGNGQ